MLDEVAFELAKANVDKNITGAPLHERLMMLHRLVAGRERFSMVVTSHGRFLDKTRALRRLFPAAELFFIVGFDTLVRVFDPKYYANRDAELAELFAQSCFLCANRGKTSVRDVRAWLECPENECFADAVLTVELDASTAAVSSTRAREELSRVGVSADVPPSVLDYIRERQLYR